MVNQQYEAHPGIRVVMPSERVPSECEIRRTLTPVFISSRLGTEESLSRRARRSSALLPRVNYAPLLRT